MRLGRICRDRAAGDAPDDAAHAATVRRLLAGASRVALRYGPLKPLLRLLQPLQGETAGAGYTF